MPEKKIDAERVQSGIDAQGFEYYLEHYAHSDLVGTPAWGLVELYLDAKAALVEHLVASGVDLSS